MAKEKNGLEEHPSEPGTPFLPHLSLLVLSLWASRQDQAWGQSFMIVLRNLQKLQSWKYLCIIYSLANLFLSVFFFFLSSFLKNNFLIYLWFVLGLHCCTGFSLVVASRAYFLVAVHRLLIALTSLAGFSLHDFSLWASHCMGSRVHRFQ